VFIDECENVCSEDSPFLRELLVELEKSEGLVLMTTNRPQVVAPAVDRRVTLKVPFEVPDASLRRRIWEQLLPGTVPLSDDVDLDYLARAFALAGGYIKNAVLTAVGLALGRAADGDLILTQADLEEAAGLQERRIAPATVLGKLRTPRVTLADCAVSGAERRKLAQIARTIGNYRRVGDRWGWNDRKMWPRSLGFKVLFHGDDYEVAIDAAEAVAGEQAMRINEFALSRIIGLSMTEQMREDDEAKRTRFQIADVFLRCADNAHLMVVTDEHGFLKEERCRADLGDLLCFMRMLADFDGTVVVVSSARRASLPPWASVFHQTVRFHAPDVTARAAYWRRALNGAVPVGRDVDPMDLACRYEFDFGKIRDAVHQACLLTAGEDPDGALASETLGRAAHQVAERNGKVRPLFGGRT